MLALDSRIFFMCFASADKMPCACASNCGCEYDAGDCCTKTHCQRGHSETKFRFVHSLLFDQPCVVTRWMHKCVCALITMSYKQTPVICTCSLTHRVAQIAKLARAWIPMHDCDAKCKFPNYKGDGICNNENKCYLCV